MARSVALTYSTRIGAGPDSAATGTGSWSTSAASVSAAGGAATGAAAVRAIASRERDAGRRGVAHGDDARDVLDRVAARPLRHPARDGEPVAALPGPQSLARDAGELREAGRADRLTIFARHIPRTEMMPDPR